MPFLVCSPQSAAQFDVVKYWEMVLFLMAGSNFDDIDDVAVVVVAAIFDEIVFILRGKSENLFIKTKLHFSTQKIFQI